MEKEYVSIAGMIVSLAGCLILLVNWMTAEYIDYYGIESYGYTGLSLFTSGDFDICLGTIAPILISFAFAGMFFRYLAPVDSDYFPSILICGLLILVGSVFEMWWIGPGTYTYTGYQIRLSIGIGPFAAIALGVLSTVLAYRLDQLAKQQPVVTSPPTDIYVPPYQPQPVQTTAPRFAMYCPKCGNGISEKDLKEQQYCMHCGAFIGTYTQRADQPESSNSEEEQK